MTATDFIVARDDFETCKTIATTLPEIDALPQDALPMLERCLSVVESRGPEAMQRVYLDTLKGAHSA